MSKEESSQIPKFTFISLFSGCGGFDEGFEQSGFECLGAFDNDQSVLDVYRRNLKGPTFLHDLSSNQLPNESNFQGVDVLIAGSPCQGFSTAGLRNLNDPRNKLLLVGGAIAKTLRPRVVISENVMGSLSGAHKIYWDTLVNDLESLGYNIKFLKCSATDFGLAQLRKRIFMIAWRGSKDVDFTLETVPGKTLQEALDGVDSLPNQEHIKPITDPLILKLATYIKPGQKLCNVRGGDKSVHTWDIPEVFGFVTKEENQVLEKIKELRRKIRLRKSGDADPVAVSDLQLYCNFYVQPVLNELIRKKFIRKIGERYDLQHTFNGLYKKLEWTKPSMTVDTRFGDPRFFLHPEEVRGFSVREAARIQGFRDSFVFSGKVNQQFKMIGNAVPPPMAKGVADLIRRVL
ncbi:DNA cytosine methyltransferase [Pontibacter pudoricolor]|uniref:DNA cytosine methyltransferase n=1 Tax=Pontibacter pudoricolor TaxID=2694930 RepID=UPI0013919C51|nr:DNA cytosine methyltransferase [Pontibacter pudoricolor]